MEIRKANPKDAKALNELNEQYFGETRNYEQDLESSDIEIYIYEIKDNIIGITGITKNDWNNTAQLYNIFVHPDCRKQGIGKELVSEMIKLSKSNNFRCLIAETPSESNAPTLFKSLGFRKCGYNDRYYTNDSSEIAEFYSYDIK